MTYISRVSRFHDKHVWCNSQALHEECTSQPFVWRADHGTKSVVANKGRLIPLTGFIGGDAPTDHGQLRRFKRVYFLWEHGGAMYILLIYTSISYDALSDAKRLQRRRLFSGSTAADVHRVPVGSRATQLHFPLRTTEVVTFLHMVNCCSQASQAVVFGRLVCLVAFTYYTDADARSRSCLHGVSIKSADVQLVNTIALWSRRSFW